MIKGTRIEATNSGATIAPGLASAYGLLTLPTGKTFILTDLIAAFRPTASTGTSEAGVALMDKAFGAGVSAYTQSDVKVYFPSPGKSLIGTATNGISPSSVVITDLVNGPEFSTCVTAGAFGTFAIPTFGIWIAGIMR